MIAISKYFREVPALDEVTCHITSRLPVDCRGNVMPGHPGRGVPVNEISKRFIKLNPVFEDEIAVVLSMPESGFPMQLSHTCL